MSTASGAARKLSDMDPVEELAELRYRHFHELDAVKRATMGARIRALTPQEGVGGDATPEGDPSPSVVMSGLLSLPEPAPVRTPHPDAGWHKTRAFPASELLGLNERNVRPSPGGTPIRPRET